MAIPLDAACFGQDEPKSERTMSELERLELILRRMISSKERLAHLQEFMLDLVEAIQADNSNADNRGGYGVVGYTTYRDGKRVGEMSVDQAGQAASAEGIGLILAEDARIENGRISNIDYLCVKIAEAVESGVYNGFTKHLPHQRT